MDREVGIAIRNASLFIPVISRHFDQSSWLHHELAAALTSRIPIVPVIESGVTPPVTVTAFKQVRIKNLNGDISASELLDKVQEIISAAGNPKPTDFDDDGMDSGPMFIGTEDLRDELVGSRWTWCENSEFFETGMWIEFEADGILRRSWRSEPGRWKVSENGFVIYKPHALKFDDQCQEFQGVTADPTQSVPERSGKRIR